MRETEAFAISGLPNRPVVWVALQFGDRMFAMLAGTWTSLRVGLCP